MRPGPRMILFSPDGIARLAPEIADQAPERRIYADLARQIGGDLDVLRQQTEREAGGEGSAEHVLLDEIFASEAAPGRSIDDIGHYRGVEAELASDHERLHHRRIRSAGQ